jgi:hypothetical protein
MGVYTTGTITYNGSNSLSWTADIKILFMSNTTDAFYINTITSASSPLTCADDNVIWCRLVNSDSNVTLSASTQANFDRAGDLSNQSADVFILGFTDTTRFHYVSGGGTHPVVETDGGTGQTGYAQGDILYSDATNSLTKLTKGTNGQFLKIGSTIPAWVDNPTEGTFTITIAGLNWRHVTKGQETGTDSRRRPIAAGNTAWGGTVPDHTVMISDNAATMADGSGRMLMLDLGGHIPRNTGKTTTITQVDICCNNDGGGSSAVVRMNYQDWDQNTGEGSVIDACTNHASDSGIGVDWEVVSFTSDLTFTADMAVWLEMYPGSGYSMWAGVQITYTVAA